MSNTNILAKLQCKIGKYLQFYILSSRKFLYFPIYGTTVIRVVPRDVGNGFSVKTVKFRWSKILTVLNLMIQENTFSVQNITFSAGWLRFYMFTGRVRSHGQIHLLHHATLSGWATMASRCGHQFTDSLADFPNVHVLALFASNLCEVPTHGIICIKKKLLLYSMSTIWFHI